jgi:hypothetical protein
MLGNSDRCFSIVIHLIQNWKFADPCKILLEKNALQYGSAKNKLHTNSAAQLRETKSFLNRLIR